MASKSARQFYDRISHAYDLIADAGEHKARDRGLELLAAGDSERVLEVGFGTGHALESLAHAVGPVGRVWGVDISSGMANVARRRIEQAGLTPRVTLEVAAVPPLPFDDNSFDAAFLSFTLELFPLGVLPRVLGELRRVLRPGGRLGVVSMAAVPVGESPSLLEVTYIWMHRHFPHIVDCQPIEAEALVETAGFELIEQERVDLFTMPVAVLVGQA